MGAVDLGILREMMSARTVLFGSWNPRLSAEAIARRLKIDPSTVRARTRAWEKSGFLLGTSVLPNPRLFGAGVHACGLEVPDPRDKPRVLEDLVLIDGALVTLDHVGPWIGTSFVIDHPSMVARREAALKRIPGVAGVQPFFEAEMANPGRAPTALDWRILAAAHRAPKATLTALAKEVGVSVNTVHARYSALIAADTVWSVPNLDFTKFGGGSLIRLILVVKARADGTAAVKTISEKFKPPISLQAPSSPAGEGPHVVDLLLHADSAAEVEDVQLAALAVPGVLEAEVLYPRRYHVHVAWAAERIAERVAATAAERAGAPGSDLGRRS